MPAPARRSLPPGVILLTTLLLACVAPIPDSELATPTPFPASTPILSPPARPERTPVPLGEGIVGRLPADAYFSRTPLPLPTPVADRRFERDERLQREIESLLRDAEGTYAIYVRDLASGRGAAANHDLAFYSASLFKVGVMFEVFHQVVLGLIDLEEELVVTERYLQFDLGTRPIALGDVMTVRQALQHMMSVSDNVAANLLLDRAGPGNVNRSLAAIGAVDTGIVLDLLPVTAADMALLLENVYRAPGFPPEARREMYDLLLSERIDNGLKAALPAEAEVAHKTGNWSNATHDVGIVTGPRGAYVIVVLSDRDHETAVIRAVSRLVWDFFNAAP